METEATQPSQSADLYYLAAWLSNNRKRVTTIVVAVVAVGAIAGGYYMYQTNRESSASEALSNVPLPNTITETVSPQPYLKVVDDFSGTAAAGRALLMAGSIQFANGKFADSQTSFQKFLSDYSSSPLANQAQVGVAASLEAQGKLADATTRYEDIVKRHQMDATTPQANSALARLYLAQNKPELALQQYEDLVKAGNNDTWTSEANSQLEELLVKYPNLRKSLMPPVLPVAPSAATSQATTPPATSTFNIPAKTTGSTSSVNVAMPDKK